MTCSGFNSDSYASYALGIVAEDNDPIAEHVERSCETCLRELSVYEEVWHQVGLAAPQVKTPRSLRGRILSEVRGRTQPWWTMPLRVTGALAGVALVACVGWIGGTLSASRGSPLRVAFLPRSAGPPFPPALAIPITASPTATVEREASAVFSATTEIEALNQELIRERDRRQQLETEIRNLAVSNSPSSPKPAADRASPPVESDAPEQRYRNQIDAAREEIRTLNRRLGDANSHVATLERAVAQYQVLLDTERRRDSQSTLIANMITGPGLKVIPIKGTERATGIHGSALISGTTQMILGISNLPPLPGDRVYQVWLLRSTAPAIASGGMLRPDANNRATIQIGNSGILGNITAIALTDEPAGGSPQPTGQKWALGL